MDPLFELALLIKAGQRELERRTNEVMRPLGLTGAQADAIAVLGQAGTLSLRELGELLIAEAGHPSRLVDRLVAAGLVERRVSDDDRRRIELTLTPKGQQLERQIQKARADLFALARSLIGDRDIQPVLDFLRDLTEYSSFRELVNRRRALDEQQDAAASQERAPA
jgi:MarR family transcriptional regulator, organic hydroperoxide resistance regulator